MGDVGAVEAKPVDVGEEAGEGALGEAHAGGEAVGFSVGPAHASGSCAAGEVGPLHVAEVLVVEGCGEGSAAVFEGVDGAVLGVEEGALVVEFGD